MKGLLKGFLVGAAITGGALLLAIVSEHTTEKQTRTVTDPETGEDLEIEVKEKEVIHFGKIDPNRVKNFPKEAAKSIKKAANRMAEWITDKYYNCVAYWELHKKELSFLKFALSFLGVILGLSVKMKKCHDVFIPPKFSMDRYSSYERDMFLQVFLDAIYENGGETFRSKDGLNRIVCTVEAA